jgi:hypothetical protein
MTPWPHAHQSPDQAQQVRPRASTTPDTSSHGTTTPRHTVTCLQTISDNSAAALDVDIV